ncbi:MAG: cysteine--tRNA ligase [Alphaproteobacteria bacterium]
MPKLRLYNSLTREKEEFIPLRADDVRVYACGPTVYNYAHIGNARMAVVFDLLANVLRSIYPKVTYVSNITDIDDKIIAAAKESGETIDAITKKFEEIYNSDMKALGVDAPDVQPRATEFIEQMKALIQKLIDEGHAYEAEAHVLFHVPSFKKYGELSGRSRDEQIAGARVEISPFKKDPADFVLWKPSAADQPGWDSPWGRGRPGWHIECSAMAGDILKLPFDIHGGGADLKFPHHENEIAQSCCAQGDENDLRSFANFWVHNGFVTVGGEKMSKSLGNFLLVHDLVKEFPGEALRLTLLSAHYRQPLDLTKEKIAESKRVLDRFYRMIDAFISDPRVYESKELPQPQIIPEVLDALFDDLNTPKAIAELHRFFECPHDNLSALKVALDLVETGKLLGIFQANPHQWLGYGSTSNSIEKLLAERIEAKKAKNFKRADEIRDEVNALGFAIEDTPEGPKARKIN